MVDHPDDPRFNGVSKNLTVWTAEPVTLMSEWRVYVAYGTVLAIQLADHGGERSVRPDETSIHAAVATLVAAGMAPAGFVIDFGDRLLSGREPLTDRREYPAGARLAARHRDERWLLVCSLRGCGCGCLLDRHRGALV